MSLVCNSRTGRRLTLSFAVQKADGAQQRTEGVLHDFEAHCSRLVSRGSFFVYPASKANEEIPLDKVLSRPQSVW